jgi:hypothetical protein
MMLVEQQMNWGVPRLESAGNVGIFNPFCFVIHAFEIERKTSWRCNLSMIDSL